MDAIRQSILIAEDVIAASHATLSTEESTASINSSDGQSHIAIPKVYRTAHRKRAAAACRSCRERKVRCDVSTHGSPCHNCQHDELECYVPEKKRRRYHEHSVSNSLNKQKAACHEIVTQVADTIPEDGSLGGELRDIAQDHQPPTPTSIVMTPDLQEVDVWAYSGNEHGQGDNLEAQIPQSQSRTPTIKTHRAPLLYSEADLNCLIEECRTMSAQAINLFECTQKITDILMVLLASRDSPELYQGSGRQSVEASITFQGSEEEDVTNQRCEEAVTNQAMPSSMDNIDTIFTELLN